MAGTVVTALHGLRASGAGLGPAGGTGACWIIRVDPRDGADCVFRDAPVVARFSGCLDPASVSADTFRVLDDQGPLSGDLRVSPDGRVLIWTPLRPLSPDQHHFVVASGLRDVRGREGGAHLSRFRTCGLTRQDLSG